MGLSSYPHQLTKHMMEVEQIIRGDTKSLDNVLGRGKVILNILRTFSYKPSIHWVYKVRWDKKISFDI